MTVRELLVSKQISMRDVDYIAIVSDDGVVLKEPLINSHLTVGHATRLHLFPQLAQKISARRQPYLDLFGQPDEKSVGAICAPELISASLTLRISSRYGSVCIS